VGVRETDDEKTVRRGDTEHGWYAECVRGFWRKYMMHRWSFSRLRSRESTPRACRVPWAPLRTWRGVGVGGG
jgi:hypothetical protein